MCVARLSVDNETAHGQRLGSLRTDENHEKQLRNGFPFALGLRIYWEPLWEILVWTTQEPYIAAGPSIHPNSLRCFSIPQGQPANLVLTSSSEWFQTGSHDLRVTHRANDSSP